jgi:hypothetical protein
MSEKKIEVISNWEESLKYINDAINERLSVGGNIAVDEPDIGAPVRGNFPRKNVRFYRNEDGKWEVKFGSVEERFSHGKLLEALGGDKVENRIIKNPCPQHVLAEVNYGDGPKLVSDRDGKLKVKLDREQEELIKKLIRVFNHHNEINDNDDRKVEFVLAPRENITNKTESMISALGEIPRSLTGEFSHHEVSTIKDVLIETLKTQDYIMKAIQRLEKALGI